MSRLFMIALLCCCSSGCMIWNSRDAVTNPIPELSTVAVAPFFNLSSERAVNGRRFAEAYFAELQKIPGFKVVPVGVTEVAIIENELAMDNPQDALKLAEILDVDAVVIGAVTDYKSYYPPRLGLEVAWYSPRDWDFAPGPQVDPYKRRLQRYQERFEREQQRLYRQQLKDQDQECRDCPPELGSDLGNVSAFRGQSPENDLGIWKQQTAPKSSQLWNPWREMPTARTSNTTRGRAADIGILRALEPAAARSARSGTKPWTEMPMGPATTGPMTPAQLVAQNIPTHDNSVAAQAPQPLPKPIVAEHSPDDVEPIVPLMSYTRMFDATDPKLMAALRDYAELAGDERSGGWEAYLHRSEDFVRFASHIVEMLTLHGGEGKRQFVLMFRKYR